MVTEFDVQYIFPRSNGHVALDGPGIKVIRFDVLNPVTTTAFVLPVEWKLWTGAKESNQITLTNQTDTFYLAIQCS